MIRVVKIIQSSSHFIESLLNKYSYLLWLEDCQWHCQSFSCICMLRQNSRYFLHKNVNRIFLNAKHVTSECVQCCICRVAFGQYAARVQIHKCSNIIVIHFFHFYYVHRRNGAKNTSLDYFTNRKNPFCIISRCLKWAIK